MSVSLLNTVKVIFGKTKQVVTPTTRIGIEENTNLVVVSNWTHIGKNTQVTNLYITRALAVTQSSKFQTVVYYIFYD